MISYKKQCLKYVYIYNKANHQFDDETVIRYYTPIISWNIHRHVQPPASYISSIYWVHHIYLHHLLTNLFDQTLFRVKNWNHQPYATACYNQPYVSSSPLPRFPNSPKILGYQKIPTYVWKYGTPEIQIKIIKLSSNCPYEKRLWLGGIPKKAHVQNFRLPSGNFSHNYGKSPFLIGKLTINGHFQ